MTENEKLNLYKTLEQNKVSKKEETHKIMYLGQHYTDTVYAFGNYKVVDTWHTNENNETKNFVCVFDGNRPLGGWYEKQPEKSKDIHDIYMAAKNKAEKVKIPVKQYQ